MLSAVVKKIPYPILAETTLPGARSYSLIGSGFDYALGGLPFNGAASEQRPVVRQTAPVRKEQADVSREPGEHSLAFWWLRAQSSFHGGAGQKYLGSADSDNEGISAFRYADSESVDVFSRPGSASLLPATIKLTTSSGTPLMAVADAGYLYVSDGASLTRYGMTPKAGQPNNETADMDFPAEAVPWGGTLTIRSLAAAGSDYFLATDEGVYRGSGIGAATKIYALTAGSSPLLAYVKERLILAVARPNSRPAVYELDAAAAANTALPPVIFTASSSTAWRWTDVAETPTSILLSGDNGTRSVVYKMSMDTNAAVPTVMPGVVVAEFPPSELVQGMNTYLGTVIGVQTTAGFRVGVLDQSGDFQYGGLLFEHARNKASGAVIGQGNSLYAGYVSTRGNPGLARIDLSNSYGSGQSLRFPWAPDLRADTGGSTADATIWAYGRKVFTVAGQGVYVQSHAKESRGSITTSRIRWDTLETKLVRFARVRGEGSGTGRITLEMGRDSDVTSYSVGAIDLAKQTDSGDMYVQLPPAQFLTLKIRISGGNSSFTGYQLKALPAQRRQRILSIPLYCFDREIDNSGQVVGADGSAMARILAVESLEQSGQVVALQWLNSYSDQQLTEYVVIEQVQFLQTSGPSDSRGWGGILTLELRTVG